MYIYMYMRVCIENATSETMSDLAVTQNRM